MISGQELFAERERIKRSLDTSLQKAYENGIEVAEKTRAYRVALKEEELRLQMDGQAQTTLKDLAKGAEKVAQAEFEMTVAEVKYRASNENIMAQKKFLESIEADIKREYFKGTE